MGNLLKRNEFGGIDRVCQYSREINQRWGCGGCEHHTKCNADIYERLAQYEESGLEPHMAKSLANQFLYQVTEFCPHCESEITMIWDVKTRGYKAFCPVCGERLMLCDECIHAEDALNEECRNCDWQLYDDGTERCFRCQ